jgi:hypothetical protein
LPVLFFYLKTKKKDWRNLSLQDFLELIISKFVVEQHELMIPEKDAGTSWLTYDSGHMYFENDFDGPSPGSSRFGAANQILCDLGLISYDNESVPHISAYSETILSEILQ